MITCILFDLDGVLLDATELHFEALNRALLTHDYAPISRADHERRFNGLPTRIKLRMLGASEDVAVTKQAETMRLLAEMRPDFSKVLMLLLLHRSYSIGVCSNAVRETVDMALSQLGLTAFVDAVFSNEDAQPKPSPEMYLKAMKQFRALPCETLIVEDSNIGERAAIASGAHVLKVDGYNDVSFEAIGRKLAELRHTDRGARHSVLVVPETQAVH